MRERILQAAQYSFYVRGYGHTPVREVASAAEVSVGGIYHHFSSKEDLLFAIIDAAIDRLRESLEAARDSASSPEQRLRRIIAALVRTVIADRRAIRLLIDNADKLDPERREALRKKRHDSALLVRREIDALAEEGRLQDIDPTVATFALLGMANWTYYWYDPGGPVDPDTLVEQLSRVFLRGVLQ